MNLTALQNDVARVGAAVQSRTGTDMLQGAAQAYAGTEVVALVMDEGTRALYGAAQFHVQRVGLDETTGQAVITLGAAESIKGRSLLYKHGRLHGFVLGFLCPIVGLALWEALVR